MSFRGDCSWGIFYHRYSRIYTEVLVNSLHYLDFFSVIPCLSVVNVVLYFLTTDFHGISRILKLSFNSGLFAVDIFWAFMCVSVVNMVGFFSHGLSRTI